MAAGTTAGTGRGADDALVLPAELVSGEAVALELRPASALTRILAQALDVTVQLAVALVAVLVVGAATSGADEAALGAGGLLVVVGVTVLLPITWESLSRGRSPGKAAAGLRVVRDDGGAVRARQAVVRALVGFGEIWLTAGSAALICSLVDPRGKRIGDHLAGTHVVRTRAPAPTTAPLVAPPELAAWAAAADIGPLPDALAAAARQVLGRLDRLHPRSREELLARLTAQVLERVAPPPPAGSPPERVLAAVLAERRDRDLVRMQRRRDRRDELAERSRRLQGL